MDKLNISFEYFPPRTEAGKDTLLETALKLSELNPLFFSVTFGAGGSTQTGTLDTLKMLQSNTRISTAPHLSCIGSTRSELTDIINLYKSLGVKRIVALRGDLPSGMGQIGELRFGSDLVALIREISKDHFYIEVAAYPEYHPQAKNPHVDLYHFKRKVEAGANSAITQYFYNPDAYFYFLDACAKNSIYIPIVPGIMPITNYTKLMRFSEICGAEIPRWIMKRLEGYADDTESIKSFGIEVVHRLCQTLIAGGAPGLHFYTLNHSDPSYVLAQMVIPALDRNKVSQNKIS